MRDRIVGLSALVVTADLEGRKQFKEHFPALKQFDRIYYACSLTEASLKLDGIEPINVVMISSRFSGDVVSEFITASKRRAQGANSAYVLLFDMRESSVAEMLAYHTENADGFLFEPWTAIDAAEQIDNARRVSNFRSKQNFELLMEKHIAKVFSVIDECAKTFQGKTPPKHLLKGLKTSGTFFQELPEEFRDEFFERLAQRASTREPAKEPQKEIISPKSGSRAKVIRKR